MIVYELSAGAFITDDPYAAGPYRRRYLASEFGRMSETITWGDGLFWYSWREPVSANGDPARTAETIAHVLAVGT